MCPGEAWAVLQISAERRRATVPVLPTTTAQLSLEAAAPSSKTKLLWLLTLMLLVRQSRTECVHTIAHDRFLRRAAAPGGRRRGARGAQRPAPRRRLPERRCVVPFPDPRAHTSADAEIALRPKMLTRCGMLAADLALH